MMDLRKIVDPLISWYDANRRILPWREDPRPYHVWVSEIMLQQTRVEAVIEYYHRFLARFPDVLALAEAELDEVLSYWQGLGYYRRCEMLHHAAGEVAEKYDGVLPADFESILALPGVGRYTAAAIMSIGFEKPYPAVDGNVLRVIMRVTDRDECIDDEKVKRKVERELAEIMPSDRASAFTQGLMDLGATVCLPNGEPKCDICPWHAICEGKRRASELPVRKEKKARKKEKRSVFLLVCGDELALRKRPSKGLLANMWEFPNTSGYLTENEVLMRFDGNVRPLGNAVHVFSHIEWYMQGFVVELTTKPQDDALTWVKKEEIANYAIPSAFSYFKTEL